MKKKLFFLILFMPFILYSQEKTTLSKHELVGTWVIKEIKVNGVISSEFDPSFHDEIILREDNTLTITDKAYGYDQLGSWRIIDSNYLEITDNEDGEILLFEIASFELPDLVLSLEEDGCLIAMVLFKK